MEEVTNIVEPKRKYLDPVGLSIFGEEFNGFKKIAEIADLIPSFKDYYYSAKVKNPNEPLSKIVRGFNSEVSKPLGRLFHPSMTQMRTWRARWDKDLMEQMKEKDLVISEKRNIHQIVKTRDEQDRLIMGGADDNQLEGGVRTLGGELLNDAMQMLRDDQEVEEMYDNETLMKRRNYVINVFSHVTKLVHGKAALMLKASAEKRDTASFLMSLLSRAAAGQMTDEEMNLLKTAYKPSNEPTPQQSV